MNAPGWANTYTTMTLKRARHAYCKVPSFKQIGTLKFTVALCDNKAALADSCLQSFSDLLTGQIGAVLAYMPPKL